MSLQKLIERIGALCPTPDERDLPALVELHDALTELGQCTDLADADAAGLAAQAVACLQRVVLRETEEAGQELEEVARIISRLEAELTEVAPDALVADLESMTARLLAADAEDAQEVAEIAAAAGALATQLSDCDGEERGLFDALSALAAARDADADAVGLIASAAEALSRHCDELREAHVSIAERPQDPPARPFMGEDASEAGGTTDAVQTPASCAPPPGAVPEPDSDQAVPRLPKETDLDLLREFAVECLDHIAAAEAALLELESQPDAGEEVNTVFRAFHTIKGTSGFLGLDAIQSLAHLAENLLDRARNGDLRVVGGYADLSLSACDALKTMIAGIELVTPGEALPMPADYDSLMAVLRDPEGAGISEEADCQPLRTGDILVARGLVARELVEESAQRQGKKPIGRALVEQGAIKPAQAVDAIRTQRGTQSRTAEATVRVGTDRLDRLIDAVGELVIAQSMVTQDTAVTQEASPQLARNVAHASKIVRELQEVSMSLRMVPLKSTFGKMARLSRDLARKAGKQVRFAAEGEDTEIDRNLVETLGDPLVHMMRNALDHGIETPEVRAAAGKEPVGVVRLRAYHAAGNVVIELSDDGKGLDRERILAKARDRGLVQPGETLSDSEVFGLIFRAGLSTAEKVTDVSGRGVGMDVVKTSIESLRGRVEVDSRPGGGTTITIRLPLTMAIADAMLLRVAQQRYLLPIASIERSFRPERGQVSTVVGRGEIVNVRGELLPILRLYQQFDITGAATDPHDALLIIIAGEGRRCALMVDDLLGQQQVVVKSLGRSLGQVPGIAGGAILGDGRVGLILDATGLMNILERTETGSARAAPERAPSAHSGSARPLPALQESTSA